MKVRNKYLATDSRTVPTRLQNVKTGRCFCSGGAISTAFNTGFLESWFRSKGRVLPERVQPIAARLPPGALWRPPRNRHAVHQVNMPGRAPPMVASVRPQRALQEFEMIVPISVRQPGPGVWNRQEAIMLTMGAYFWEQFGQDEKEHMCILLWRCFNHMFPTESQENAEQWAAEQWYEPRVALHGLMHAQNVADFECQSLDNRCTVRIHVHDNFVQVYYRGPVFFDLNLAHAARARARDEFLEQATAQATDVWNDVMWADNQLQHEQARQNTARAERRARDEQEERERAERLERRRQEAIWSARREEQRRRAALLDVWSHDDQADDREDILDYDSD